MDQKIQNLMGVIVVIVLLGSMVAGLWYVSSFAKSSTPERRFQVQGEGKVVAVPNVAEVSFGVLTEGGKDLSKLQSNNSDKVNSMIAFLKDNGVETKDIKTSYYNISPRYQYFSCPSVPLGESEFRPCPPSEITGYSINQTITVKIRDFNKAGEILSGVVDRGANNVSGPNFTVDDVVALQNHAREEAVKQAKEKAESMAKAGGFHLGKLLSISEGFYMPQPIYAAEGFGGAIIKESAVPVIEPGSQEITVNVTLTYEIK